jgi:hypothetical protein
MRLHPASAPVQLQTSWAINSIVWNGTHCAAAPRARAQPASLTLAACISYSRRVACHSALFVQLAMVTGRERYRPVPCLHWRPRCHASRRKPISRSRRRAPLIRSRLVVELGSPLGNNFPQIIFFLSFFFFTIVIFYALFALSIISL